MNPIDHDQCRLEWSLRPLNQQGLIHVCRRHPSLGRRALLGLYRRSRDLFRTGFVQQKQTPVGKLGLRPPVTVPPAEDKTLKRRAKGKIIMTWNAEEFRAPDVLPFVRTAQKFMRATAVLQAHAIRAGLRCQIESASFLKRRFEDDLKLLDKLTGSDEFVDAFDVYVNFVQNATSDYANEAGRFASIGAKLASETAGRVRKEAETTIDDMAAATIAT
ncbi:MULTISPECIES: hypothetical protein [unclassified Mesorhizobium]|nr:MULTISPECIES: hypothetical protein [unclassified Mesorhizobium]